jgi:hypothetical protein
MFTEAGLKNLKKEIEQIRKNQNVEKFNLEQWVDAIFEQTGIELEEEQVMEIFETL